ncbi:hypothetical protein OHB44_27985 [Micromonospora sp. NBC_00821]|uniref:hypothetical protein n=1 Tax=Micromonospora sp. NBC_00821 TaxID=2975977 RepID=UPI002ED161BE|nr:hypothetical protein OHB44_27985 [Micromonospora sp. NBC_00821]
MRYKVNHSYSAFRDGQRFGPWVADEVVELDPADAGWVERDSPGALAEVKPEPEPEPEPERERQKPPAANRQHRGGANRSG